MLLEDLWAKAQETPAANRDEVWRGLFLEAWREHRCPELADLIEACDVALGLSDRDAHGQLRRAQRGLGSARFPFLLNDWRSWFDSTPDDVAGRFAVFETHPDPALTRVLLELVKAAPLHLLPAERVWSSMARVLVALGDRRAIASLERLLTPDWPPHRPHLAIQSVPHLAGALDALQALPEQAPLALPPFIVHALEHELAAVRATAEVAALDPLEARQREAQLAAHPTPTERALFADWLLTQGDPRGLALTEANESVCLGERLSACWETTAPIPVRSISLRAGLPHAVELGTTKWTVPPSSAPWPWWPHIDTVVVPAWEPTFTEVLSRLGRIKHLGQVPWSELATLDLTALEVFDGGFDEPIDPAQVIARCPALRRLSANLAEEGLERLEALRHLRVLELFRAPTAALVQALSRLPVAERRIFHQGLVHHLSGALEITTSVYQPDFDEAELAAADAAFVAATSWALTDDTITAFPELATWFMTHRRSGRRTA